MIGWRETEGAFWLVWTSIAAAGVVFVHFLPTGKTFTHNLPRHVQGRLAVVLGRPKPLHMVPAVDFARMVSRAVGVPDVAKRNLFVHGPEPVTTAEALQVYCALVEPDKRVLTIRLALMRLVDRRVMAGRLRANLELMALLQRLGERGDPAEANRLLGAPTTTVRQWCERQAAAG